MDWGDQKIEPGSKSVPLAVSTSVSAVPQGASLESALEIVHFCPSIGFGVKAALKCAKM